MAMMAGVISALVTLGFGYLSIGDIRTQRVVVDHARAVTAAAVAGLGAVGLLTTSWVALTTAAIGAVLVLAVQLVPYRLQGRSQDAIGRADVRLAVPFGWTLGFHGLGFVIVGFAVALLTGLLVATLGRRRRIPFVPFMTLGLAVGLSWALIVA